MKKKKRKKYEELVKIKILLIILLLILFVSYLLIDFLVIFEKEKRAYREANKNVIRIIVKKNNK